MVRISLKYIRACPKLIGAWHRSSVCAGYTSTSPLSTQYLLVITAQLLSCPDLSFLKRLWLAA